MNSLTTFSILFKTHINNDNIVIPDDFDLLKYPKQIRELTYLYFSEIKNNVENKLTFEQIANYISNDNDFKIIPNTINSEIYYQNKIVLNKRFEFDEQFELLMNEIKLIPEFNVDDNEKFSNKYNKLYNQYLNLIPYKSVHYNDGWNINNYLKNKYISIYNASRFTHSSEIIDLDYLKLCPDYFNVNIIYSRFKDFNPSYFKTFNKKCDFINLYLDDIEHKKLKLKDEYFVSDYNILMKIFKNKTKKLPSNFDEIVMNIDINFNNIKSICDEYVKWLCYNYKPEYVFNDLLKHASSLNLLFERNLYIPILAKENLNFGVQNIQLYDLICNKIPYTNSIWGLYKDEESFKIIYKSTEFRKLKKIECIAFYNRFYDCLKYIPTENKKDVEYIKHIFEGKLLTYNDIKELYSATVDQIIYLDSNYPKKFKEIEKARNSLLAKIKNYDYYEAINKKLIPYKNLDFNKYYDKDYSNHDEYVKYVTENKLVLITNGNKILTDNRLKNNISWLSLINCSKDEMCKYLNYFIDNIPITNTVNSYDKIVDLVSKVCKIYCTYLNKETENENEKITINTFDKLLKMKELDNPDFLKLFKFDLEYIVLSDKISIEWIDFLIKLGYRYFFDTEENISKYFDKFYNNKCYINNVDSYIINWIISKSELTFEDIIKNYEEVMNVKVKEHQFDKYACIWCKYRKIDPPYDMWPQTPNRELQKAYREYISEELPKEYTDKRFYEYMMKNKSKRPEHCTSVYTLFSNNIENKVIFVDDTFILDDKYAQLRFTIDVDYHKVRKFISEELNINNMTTRTCLSDYDFAKVCGGNTLIDCFVFSDFKNIYKEITPLTELLDFFKTSLEIKFNVEIKNIEE